MSGDVIDKGQVIMTVEGMKMEVCYIDVVMVFINPFMFH